jgi:hypothetical protein
MTLPVSIAVKGAGLIGKRQIEHILAESGAVEHSTRSHLGHRTV